MADNQGNLPLHLVGIGNESDVKAFSTGPTFVSSLLDANPAAVSEKKFYGRLPLHMGVVMLSLFLPLALSLYP